MDQQACATIIVGANILFREGLIRILDVTGFRILDTAPSVDRSALDALDVHDSILFIFDTGGDPNAVLEQIRLVRQQRHKAWRAVVLDGSRQMSIAAVYRAGASAYFVSVASSDAFIKSLELVMLGETILSSDFLPFVLDPNGGGPSGKERKDDGAALTGIGATKNTPGDGDNAPMQPLSTREKAILRCIIEGCSNKTIARKIAISEATVKVHVKSILRKVRVHSRTQAAIWGMRCGPSIWTMGNDPKLFAQACLQPSASLHAGSALPQPIGGEPSLFGVDALQESESW